MTPDDFSRRQFLALGAISVAALAGCGAPAGPLIISAATTVATWLGLELVKDSVSWLTGHELDELANTAKSRQQSIEVYTGSTGVTLIATLPRDDKTQISDLVLNMGSIGLLREFLPRAIQGIAKSAQSLSQSLGKDRAIQAIVPMELYPDDSANTARKRTTSYRALDKNFVSVTYDATSTAPVEQVRVRGATFTYAVSTVDHRLLERA